MDDEFDIGASIWSSAPRTSLTIPPPAFSDPSPAPSSAQDGFDDFDEFGTPAETVAASGDEGDDDFGDFGDFGEAAEVESAATFELETFAESVPTPRVAPHDWHALQLDSSSSRNDIQQQVDGVLGPLWPSDDPSHFTDDPIRQSEGLNQILATAERYVAVRSIASRSYLKSQVAPVASCMISSCRPPSQRSSRSIGRGRASDGSISLHSAYRSTWTRCYLVPVRSFRPSKSTHDRPPHPLRPTPRR